MLNLDNIDSPESWDCPLVLTSPRSLAACRLVGVKPVDLLPKDLLELAETVGTSRLDKLTDLRNFLEHRRLTKLEHCRAIRRYLISQHAVDELHLLASRNSNNNIGVEPRPIISQDEITPRLHSNRSSVTFQHRENEFSARKSKLDCENRALAEHRKLLLTKTDDFPVRPFLREPPLSDRSDVVDCFDRTNRSQRSFQVELCPARQPPSHAIRQKRRSRSKRFETPCLSNKVGSSSSDRDGSGAGAGAGEDAMHNAGQDTGLIAGACDCASPSHAPSPSSSGRISQNLKKPSNELAEGDKDGDKTYPEQSRQQCDGDQTSCLPLLARERLSESELGKSPRSNTNICKSAKTSHQVRQRVRPGSGSPRRRTRSFSATGSASTLNPSPSVSPPVLSPAFTKCPSESGLRDHRPTSKCLYQQARSSTLHSLLCRNKIESLGSQWRRTAKAVGLSDEDHKILLLMERKALEKRAAEMSAEAARILWEREEEQRTKQREWEKERRKLEITERRNEDKAETKRRLASLERNFNRAQRRLAETLKRRDEEAQQRLRKIALQKESIRAERKAADLARQAAVEKRLRHLNQELARYQNLEAEQLEAQMRSAAGRREFSSGSVIGRETTSASLLVLSNSPKQSVDLERKRPRPSSAPGPSISSVTSDPRIVSARMIRAAIERNLAASRARSVVQSEAAVRAAASRASATIKARSARARVTFTRRRVAHLAKAARLRAVRGVAVARLRSRIRAGERKIAALMAAKERSVASSRAMAAVSAQLRHDLRGTLSPTTFDRMASDVQHLLRIRTPSSHSSRLLTPDHQSHIKLG